GIYMNKARRGRSFIFYCSLLIQASTLLLLKYAESSNGGLHFFFKEAGFQTDVILMAVGLSFYTLQHIAYLIDIYYYRANAVSNPFRFLLFSSFFAKFNSGPLEKAQSLLPQFETLEISEGLVMLGLQRILLGFFKKMLLADRLAPMVMQVYGDNDQLGSAVTAVGACIFTLQLYFDFSAYCDIAIGTAQLFGIRLSENFNYPLTSTSVSEFWRRWHISLISWFTNYIYYPIVFKLRHIGRISVLAGIVCTFLISGIWHGLGGTFLIWSLLHAMYLSYESLTKNTRLEWSKRFHPGLYKSFSIGLTFVLVCFSNLFFRAENMMQVKVLLSELCSSPFRGEGFFEGFLSVLAGGGYQEVMFNFWVTAGLVTGFLLLEKRIYHAMTKGRYVFIRISLLLVLLFIFGIFKKADYFIYLQF
ncbi:MAG TPA: MBOAT family O-acyltransferase, partial [Bacteroidia bacterium]|nr:MBOAT family O-acyltransferase [Bacteroidia bacterium]